MKLLRKVLLVLITILSLVSYVATAVGAEDTLHHQNKSKKVRAAYVLTALNFEGAEGERKSGYSYDAMEKVAAYTGWEYEFVYCTFEEALEGLKNGSIDMMADIVYTEERSKYLLYSELPQGKAGYYLLVKHDYHAIQDMQDLNGKKVGVLKDSFAENYFRKNLVGYNIQNCEVVTYQEDYQTLEALASGEIDALYCSLDVASSAQANQLTRLDFGVIEAPFYFAISKHRPDLMQELNTAMQEVLATQPDYFQHVYESYLTDKVFYRPINLTSFSKAWLARNPVLRVGYINEYAPYVMLDKQTGELSGILADVLKHICRNNNLELDVKKFNSYEEMVLALRSNEIHLVLPENNDIYFAAKNRIALSVDILDAGVRMVYKDFFAGQKPRIALEKNDYMLAEIVLKNYPQAEITYFDSKQACLQAVRDAKVNATYYLDSEFWIDTKLHGEWFESLQSMHQDKAKISLRYGVLKGNKGLLDLLNKNLENMDQGIIAHSLVKNIEVEQDHSFAYSIKNNAVEVTLFLTGFILFIVCSFGTFIYMLKKSQKSLVEARQKADAANLAKTTFLSRMSHDVRTPMNGIVGLTHMIEQHFDDKEFVADCLEKIKHQSKQLELLVNDVLDMSKIESGKVTLTHEKFKLTDVLEDLKPAVEVMAQNKDVELTFTNNQLKHKAVISSPMHIGRILVNVLTNAIKYNNPGGYVHCNIKEIPVDAEHSTYEFTVADNGIGMSEAFLEHIFEPFVREDESSFNEYHGTGLGMAITKEFTDKLGGTISIQSKTGEGTTIVIRLPLEIDSSYGPETAEETALILNGRRFLVADDVKLNLKIMQSILEEEHVLVETAGNGQEAVDKFSASPVGTFDAILMDVRMPVLNGMEATRAIRALDREDAKTIPIIALTANAFEEDKRECLEAGMNEHLGKPVDLDKLKHTLAKYLVQDK